MSSDEQDRPRKTLTIKKTARDARAESEAAPAKRSRSGAPRPPGRPDRARQGKIERLKTPDAPARDAGDGERAPRKPVAARGAASRTDAGRGRRDDGGAPRRAAGARPARAPRDRDNQYVAPATPAGRFTIRSRTTARRRNSPPSRTATTRSNTPPKPATSPTFTPVAAVRASPARPRCSRSSRPAPRVWKKR